MMNPNQEYTEPPYVQQPQPQATGQSQTAQGLSGSSPAPSPANYDFILNPAQPMPRRTMGSSSALRLTLIVGGIGLVLTLCIVILMSLLRSSPPTQTILGVVQRQQEIIRLSSLGEDEATTESLKGLAYTVDLSMSTSQDQVLAYMDKIGGEVPPEQLGLKRDKTTDTLLENAKTTSTFDATLLQTLEDQLELYLKELQGAHRQVDGRNIKKILSDSFAVGQKLLEEVQRK